MFNWKKKPDSEFFENTTDLELIKTETSNNDISEDTEKEQEIKPVHVPLTVQVEESPMNQLLNAGECFLKRYGSDQDIANCIDESKIKTQIDELDRSLKEFHSKMFFVVIFGPLKAGKSTMVNTLAHRYVSPTRLGKECTLRPSIIIQDKENGIDEYFMRDNAQDRTQVFQLVIDFIRHMKNWEEISPYVYRETSILNETNIENKLSHIMDIEPLITVIRVPGGKFIDSNTAIIDMPGLDGNISNIETSPVHNWVLRRTDFLIFIQSSISAISKTTNRFLERLLIESKNPPIWLVQNIIDGKYWRDAEERNAEALQQLSETRDEIMKELDLKELYSTPINLGMALDGVLNCEENLLETSQFNAFEDRLYTILQDKRVRIQERNSLHGLLRALKIMQNEIRITMHNISTSRQKIQKISLFFQQMESIISTYEFYGANHPQKNLEVQLTNLITSEEEGLGKLIDDRTEKTILYCNRDITGEELVNSLMDLAETIREKGNQLYLKTDGEFGIRISNQINLSISQGERFLDESLKEQQGKIDELAKQLDIIFHWISPTDLMPFDYMHLSPVMEQPFRLGRILPPTRHMLLFTRHFNGQQAKLYIQNASENIREQLQDQAEKWVESLIELHVNETQRMRKQSRLSSIAENRQYFLLKTSSYLERAQKSEQLFMDIEADLEQLIQLAQNALSSVEEVR